MDYICTECGDLADDYNDLGYPYVRECSLGGFCNFITVEENNQNIQNNLDEADAEDRRLGL